MMGKPTTSQIPADAHNYASRKGAAITGIVLHATQGWRAGSLQRFQDPTSQASCHYLVCQDGSIIQSVPDEYAAWHAGNGDVNKHTIGIELEALIEVIGKPGQWLNPPNGFTDKQYTSLIALLRYLVELYKIKPVRITRGAFSTSGIMAHADVPDPHHDGEWGGISHHTDPGPYFPWWDRIIADLSMPPQVA